MTRAHRTALWRTPANFSGSKTIHCCDSSRLYRDTTDQIQSLWCSKTGSVSNTMYPGKCCLQLSVCCRCWRCKYVTFRAFVQKIYIYIQFVCLFVFLLRLGFINKCLIDSWQSPIRIYFLIHFKGGIQTFIHKWSILYSSFTYWLKEQSVVLFKKW